MKVKTRSGICVTVGSEGSSKVVFFDKPIRTIELTRDESLQVGALLTAPSTFSKNNILLKNQETNRVNADTKITKLKITGNPLRCTK